MSGMDPMIPKICASAKDRLNNIYFAENWEASYRINGELIGGK